MDWEHGRIECDAAAISRSLAGNEMVASAYTGSHT